MRIALCLSGQMRTFDRCFPYLKKNILEPLNPDIFIHTWSNSGVCTKKKDLEKQERFVTYQELNELYSPKKIVIEDFSPSYTEEFNGVKVPQKLKLKEPRHYKGSIPMFYKIWACNELKKKYEENNNFKYDIVIRLRPDMLIHEKIPKRLLKKNHIIWLSDYAINANYQASDKFAFSKSANMDHYSSVWAYLNEYWKNPLGNGTWEDYRVGERLLKHHLESLPTKLFSLECKILRTDEIIKEPHIGFKVRKRIKKYYKYFKKFGTYIKWSRQ